MYQVLELNKENTTVPVNYAGKIVHVECFGSDSIKYDVALYKDVSYKQKIQRYIDQIPEEGTIVSSHGAYTMNDGTVLYGVWQGPEGLSPGYNSAYRNGYWDLTYTTGAESKSWTLKKFKYVEGVKTYISGEEYVATTTTEADEAEITLNQNTIPSTKSITITFSPVDEETGAPIISADVAIPVEDTYCSGSVLTIVGYTDVTDTKKVPLVALQEAATQAIVDNPKNADCAIYCNINDVITINNTEPDILASKIMVYIET